MERIYVKKNDLFYLNTYIKPIKEVIYYDIYQTILNETRDKCQDIDQIVIIVRKHNDKDDIIKKGVNSIIDIKTAVDRYAVKADRIYIDRYVDHSMLYIEIDFDTWVREKYEEIDKQYVLTMGNLVKENEKNENIIEDDSSEIEVRW